LRGVEPKLVGVGYEVGREIGDMAVQMVGVSATKANNPVSVGFQSGESIPYLESVPVNV
jgi:hypothetical protein